MLFILLPKITFKNRNHTLKNRWGRIRIWLELLWELIRSSRLLGNNSEPRGAVPSVSGASRCLPRRRLGMPGLPKALLNLGKFHPKYVGPQETGGGRRRSPPTRKEKPLAEGFPGAAGHTGDAAG